MIKRENVLNLHNCKSCPSHFLVGSFLFLLLFPFSIHTTVLFISCWFRSLSLSISHYAFCVYTECNVRARARTLIYVDLFAVSIFGWLCRLFEHQKRLFFLLSLILFLVLFSYMLVFSSFASQPLHLMVFLCM